MPKVLVVEDSPDLQFLYEMAFRDEGIESYLASNGQEALELLRRVPEKPRFILLDLMMPVMDGWEFLEQQAADPSLSGIPVVVCSASRSSVEGGHRFLKKPVELDALLAVAGEILGDGK